MGLFEDYFDPSQFTASGGLPGRLLSLLPDIPQNQDAGFGTPPLAPQAPASAPMGSQYAQAPIGIVSPDPFEVLRDQGQISGPSIVGGGLLLGGLGAALLNNDKVDRPPAGSRSIDKTPWSGDHTEIKQAVGANGPHDVRISPTGDVWAQKPDGSWENHGPADSYTGSGKPSGRRGKDRDQ